MSIKNSNDIWENKKRNNINRSSSCWSFLFLDSEDMGFWFLWWLKFIFKKNSKWSKWQLNLVAILIIFSNKMGWVLILVVTRWIYVPIPLTTKIKSTNTILMYLNVVTKFIFCWGVLFFRTKISVTIWIKTLVYPSGLGWTLVRPSVSIHTLNKISSKKPPKQCRWVAILSNWLHKLLRIF